jgi:hypothetical protein
MGELWAERSGFYPPCNVQAFIRRALSMAETFRLLSAVR